VTDAASGNSRFAPPQLVSTPPAYQSRDFRDKRKVNPAMDIWNRPLDQDVAVGAINGRFPRIILTASAAAKMEALVSCCNIEVSWLATVDFDGKDFKVDEIVVPPQYCSLGGTDFREANLMMMFMGEDGKIPSDALSMISRLRCWGHSHHNMAVFASGTDERQAKDFIEQMPDYFIRLICNKRGDMNSAIYMMDKGIVLHQPKIVHYKPTRIEREEYFAGELYPFDDWAMNEIDQKVSRHNPTLNVEDFTDEEIEELMLEGVEFSGFPDIQLGREPNQNPDYVD
jgi:hypothetical protein